MLSNTPEQIQEQIHQQLKQEGPGLQVIQSILHALKNWPEDTTFKTELYYFLQESPLDTLKILTPDLIHQLTDELQRLLPQEMGNISIVQSWVLNLLEHHNSWSEFSRLRSSLVLPKQPPRMFQHPLFQNLMQKSVLAGSEWELSLRQFRALTLSEYLYLSEPWEEVLVLLAQQAWNNQYAWYISPTEEALLQELWTQEQYTPIQIALLASYTPLKYLDKCKTQHTNLSQRHTHWNHLIQTSVLHPQQEEALKPSLPSILNTEANKSSVRPFYERFPYPRWFGPPIVPPDPLKERLERLFPYHPWHQHFFKGMRVLIAGCGTGQEMLYHYWQNPKADITGLDLSLSSLAYAQRQFQKYQVPAQFLQADLMDLPFDHPALSPFDMIESGGVVHHLDHPKQGLNNILKLLKPGGLLKLGLYSKSGRQPILHLKQSLGITQTLSVPEMRQLRQSILTSDNPDLNWIKLLSEFYQLNHCMDLLCHPQEHNYDLPELEQWFQEFNLKLIGLTLWNPRAYHWYRQQFPEDPLAVSLKNWWQCEQSQPRLFWPMYIFWLQKKG